MEFIQRHIGPDESEITAMLETIEVDSLETLMQKAVPESIYQNQDLALQDAQTEHQVLTKIRNIADKNKIYKSMLGMGYYNTIMPTVILRNVLENPGWYTAYTPYQPEISQGRLEALLNFQTMIADLTAMPIANASLLDEATAAAEAMTLAQRVNKKNKSNVFFIDENCHPQTIAVIQTRAKPLNIEVIIGNPQESLNHDIYALLIQYPGSNGDIQDYSALVEKLHSKNIFSIFAADLLALTLIKAPGEMGADIVIGSAQRFGVPMGFGGPHAAYMAVKDEFKRSIPGRLVGVSLDSKGRKAYRLTLQTREQHIRREKATSNICTAQVLLAVLAGFYAVYHGAQGLKNIALRVYNLTQQLAENLKNQGFEIVNTVFFDTITIKTDNAEQYFTKAQENQINLRLINNNHLGISLDETSDQQDIENLLKIFNIEKQEVKSNILPENLQRKSEYLTHSVFNQHHSETEMLRYIRKLAAKDIALDRSMIPLGSCTMKLNATTEMLPVTWPEFSQLHPFAPIEQAQGYLELITELETMLATATGFAKVSLQPNAGSQGEYAGLLAIQKYHKAQGQTQRNICLIPESAHGTNPASAVMAGMQVMIVKNKADGGIDIQDLAQKAEQNQDKLAAFMITYPSTNGIYGRKIVEICEIIHKYGGQVYMDGANMNALLGVAYPGEFGPDVSHLNLHKTFAIPHGGGGPGIGPIGVREHLAPYLPNHPLQAKAGPETGVGPIAAAPWGSASILPISWSYMQLLGKQGLKKATQVAVLNANYIAKRLEKHYKLLFQGANNLVAHECIIDPRDLKQTTDIIVDDIAKRLMDFGFHAPTMSFPIAGTLMIEPTESESKAELDRFCDAMIMIRQEIEKIEAGEYDKVNNPLKNAPHVAEDLLNNWQNPYSPMIAAYPLDYIKEDKYWPPVSRIDHVYGDRNVYCSCPPVEDYQ